MNVTCPSCATVFRVDPAKVPAGGVRARCTVCGAVFAVRRDREPVDRPPAPVAVRRPGAAPRARRRRRRPRRRPGRHTPPHAPPPAAPRRSSRDHAGRRSPARRGAAAGRPSAAGRRHGPAAPRPPEPRRRRAPHVRPPSSLAAGRQHRHARWRRRAGAAAGPRPNPFLSQDPALEGAPPRAGAGLRHGGVPSGEAAGRAPATAR